MLRLVICMIVLSLLPKTARAEPSAPAPWCSLAVNVGHAFSGHNLLFHAGGVLATVGMVSTGLDYEAHRLSRANERLSWLGIPGLVLGFVAPFAVVGSFYVAGWLSDDVPTLSAAAAALQATVLVFAYNALLKLITGRPPPPELGEQADAERQSRTFHFGFARGGLFDGWPSGHTALATALGVSLAAYYDATWLDVVAYAAVVYMAFSVLIFEGGVHWASDAVAAFLTSYPIAATVGRSFRAAARPEPPPKLSAAPSVQPDGLGLRVVGEF